MPPRSTTAKRLGQAANVPRGAAGGGVVAAAGARAGGVMAGGALVPLRTGSDAWIGGGGGMLGVMCGVGRAAAPAPGAVGGGGAAGDIGSELVTGGT